MMLNETGDKDGFSKASVRLKNQRRQYSEFCRQTGLKQHNDRTQVYGFDRSVSSKAVWAERKAANTVKFDLAVKPGKSDSAIANLDFINSQAYADKFKGRYANEAVENAVVSSCRQLIKKRNGTKFEEAFFIDARTGEILSYVKSKKENGVNMPESLKKRLTNAKENSIIMIHNHPNSSPFSAEDYDTASKYKSCFEAIACGHNGEVFFLRGAYGTRGEESEKYGCQAIREFRIGITKNKRLLFDEFEVRHKAWQSTAMNRGFIYEKR